MPKVEVMDLEEVTYLEKLSELEGINSFEKMASVKEVLRREGKEVQVKGG